MTNKCGICQKLFDAKHPAVKYCSKRCRWMGTHGMVPDYSMLPPGTKIRVSFDYTHLGTCGKCGSQYLTTVNFVSRRSIAKRKLCDSCLREKHAEMGRRNNATIKKRKCLSCGDEIVGYTRKTYCDECYRDNRKKSRAKYANTNRRIDPKYLKGPNFETRLKFGGDRIAQ